MSWFHDGKFCLLFILFMKPDHRWNSREMSFVIPLILGTKGRAVLGPPDRRESQQHGFCQRHNMYNFCNISKGIPDVFGLKITYPTSISVDCCSYSELRNPAFNLSLRLRPAPSWLSCECTNSGLKWSKNSIFRQLKTRNTLVLKPSPHLSLYQSVLKMYNCRVLLCDYPGTAALLVAAGNWRRVHAQCVRWDHGWGAVPVDCEGRGAPVLVWEGFNCQTQRPWLMEGPL